MPPAETPPTETPPTATPRSTAEPAVPVEVPVETLTYEQAREELVSVVQRLETGGETLEGSLALWERGEALATRCQHWLDGARRRLEQARGDDAPAVTTSTEES